MFIECPHCASFVLKAYTHLTPAITPSVGRLQMTGRCKELKTHSAACRYPRPMQGAIYPVSYVSLGLGSSDAPPLDMRFKLSWLSKVIKDALQPPIISKTCLLQKKKNTWKILCNEKIWPHRIPLHREHTLVHILRFLPFLFLSTSHD